MISSITNIRHDRSFSCHPNIWNYLDRFKKNVVFGFSYFGFVGCWSPIWSSRFFDVLSLCYNAMLKCAMYWKIVMRRSLLVVGPTRSYSFPSIFHKNDWRSWRSIRTTTATCANATTTQVDAWSPLGRLKATNAVVDTSSSGAAMAMPSDAEPTRHAPKIAQLINAVTTEVAIVELMNWFEMTLLYQIDLKWLQ